MYPQHKQSYVFEILEQYRIGNLSPSDVRISPLCDFRCSSLHLCQVGQEGQERAEDDPYRDDPSRHPAILVRSPAPFNGETPHSLLAEQW